MCNNLFGCVMGHSGRYTFKPDSSNAAACGEIAGGEDYGRALSFMDSVKKSSPERADEVKPLTEDTSDRDTEPVKVDLSKHADDQEEEQETMLINEGSLEDEDNAEDGSSD